MFVLRFKRDRLQRAVSVTFLDWSPPWHVYKIWFTDRRRFKQLLDEEIETQYKHRVLNQYADTVSEKALDDGRSGQGVTATCRLSLELTLASVR